MSKSYGYCCYCKRTLADPRSNSRVAFTRDHVRPQCQGGTKYVPCCRQCNQMKGDLGPGDWRRFTETYPTYWTHFSTHRHVREAVWQIKRGLPHA